MNSQKNNMWMKILSVVIAVLIWLFVANTNDPVVTKRFYSIPVIIIYASLDYIYSLIGHDCICPSQVEIHLHKKVSIHSVRHLLYLLSPRGDTFPRDCGLFKIVKSRCCSD